tara:strand:+ start:334 stop:525 length:192 start_codon:yes stop_codon:yes gene_type:complete
MSNTSDVIMTSIKSGQNKYSSKNTKPVKRTWQSYVSQNYHAAAKQSNEHPMTTLSREYNNLNK